MEFKILQKPNKKDQLYIIDNVKSLEQIAELTETEKVFATTAIKNEQSFTSINQYNSFVFIYFLKNKKTDWQTVEALRKAGSELQTICNKQKLAEIRSTKRTTRPNAAEGMAEGLALAN